MKIAIMQPYLFPYIGYFQLMNAVDEFIVYDNIEYTKKGWVNRNRILVNGTDQYITFQLKKDSDYLPVHERQLADVWPAERKKLLNKIKESYRKAPCFESAYPIIEEIILFEEPNLFNFILNSLQVLSKRFEITTPLIISSTLSIDHKLKGEKKVIEICKSRNADGYINPIGGVELYSKEDFKMAGINLQFLKSDAITYTQFTNPFVPWLSIIDVMMFNSNEKVREFLCLSYKLQ